MKFTHATHLLDADGAQITSGVTRAGDVHLLVMDGTGTARLTPELAERLAEILRDCARHARVQKCNACPGPASCSEFGRCTLEGEAELAAVTWPVVLGGHGRRICPECHADEGSGSQVVNGVAAAHCPGCGTPESPFIADRPEPWRCPECRTLLRYSHSDGCSMADPGPVAPSPWGDRPEPEDPGRDRLGVAASGHGAGDGAAVRHGLPSGWVRSR